MTEGAFKDRRSYAVVFESNIDDVVDFLQRLRHALEQTHRCTEPEIWKDIGGTMTITVAGTEVEVIACPLNEVSFGNVLLNIAEPFSLLKLLRKRDFKCVRRAAVQVSDGLVHCGIPFESQYWANSNPPAFHNVDDWVTGQFPC